MIPARHNHNCFERYGQNQSESLMALALIFFLILSGGEA
jgi:hypothetical protein